MAKIEQTNTFKQKWWLHPMDPENLGELSESDRQNAKRFNQWFFIWGIMFFGIALGIEPLPEGIKATPGWRLLLAFSPIIPGFFLIRAFVRLFKEMNDELIKRIHYQALAVGFLFAFVIGMCFALSAAVAGVSAKAGPAIFSGLLFGYLVGLFLEYRKYNA